MAILMQDHPAWQSVPGGAERVMRCGGGLWHLAWSTANPETVAATALNAVAAAAPTVDRVAPALSREQLTRLRRVAAAMPALRVRNGDLWDAVGTAIIRQVIRAPQARTMYARFCQAYGPPVPGAPPTLRLFPTPQVVAGLPPAAFTDLGMAFKRPALQAAAQATISHGQWWERLAPSDLVDALQTVPRVGPWTARAAAADFTGDFSLYPYDDLAVRTWARRAAPDVAWPADPATFGACWRHMTGDHLASLTLLTLAWGGTHARP